MERSHKGLAKEDLDRIEGEDITAKATDDSVIEQMKGYDNDE